MPQCFVCTETLWQVGWRLIHYSSNCKNYAKKRWKWSCRMNSGSNRTLKYLMEQQDLNCSIHVLYLPCQHHTFTSYKHFISCRILNQICTSSNFWTVVYYILSTSILLMPLVSNHTWHINPSHNWNLFRHNKSFGCKLLKIKKAYLYFACSSITWRRNTCLTVSCPSFTGIHMV